MNPATTLLSRVVLAGFGFAGDPGPSTTPDFSQLESDALRALSGPSGCHLLKVRSVQSASVPVWGSDREEVELTGRLDHGVWRDLDVRMVSDSDPSERIFDDGPLLLGEPGMGEVPGAVPTAEDTAWVTALLQPATTLRWRGGRLERTTEGAPFSSAVLVEGGEARGLSVHVTGTEAVDWTLRWDAEGLPVSEQSTLRFEVMGVTVTVKQQISYAVVGTCTL
jgi:hypothetical protein